MNRFVLALALGFTALSAHAQTDPAPVPEAAAADETIVVRDEGQTRQALDTGCVRESGTLLRKRDKKGCTGAPGQSYGRDQIERTGAIDTGDAIRKLSPSATLRRGG